MNNHPAIAGNNINRYYRRLTPLSVQEFEDYLPCGVHMQPMVKFIDPQGRFVDINSGGFKELL